VYALNGETREDVEVVVRRGEGAHDVTISMGARPMLNRAGQVRGAVLVVRDITQRKAAEALLAQQARERSEAKERAEQESRYKSRLLATLSHELRTPLNAVLGFAELLGQELFGPLNPRQKQYVSYINQGGGVLLALINDVLDISKVDDNKLDLVPEWSDPRDLINAACSGVRPLADKKNIRIQQELADALPKLWADPVRIKQVLYNLLSNAVKFTPEGGLVTLAAYVDAAHLKLRVRDTGVGISREDMPRLFREFEQIEQPSGRKSEGAGLGLALTKRLVQLHQGVIHVESEPGRGSAFEVSLPLTPQAPAQAG
jgi:signal transduction histidine kinase